MHSVYHATIKYNKLYKYCPRWFVRSLFVAFGLPDLVGLNRPPFKSACASKSYPS